MPSPHSALRSWEKNKITLILPPVLFLYLAFLILILPLKWILAAAISIAFHELCHIFVIRVLRIRIDSMRIGIAGANIRTEPMTNVQELLCALAGPLGGLLLLLFARWVPRISVCAAFHSLYNLLPVYPSDGGRALRCGARLMMKEKDAERVCSSIETVFVICLILLGLYAAFCLRLGLLPLLLSSVIAARKIPCKLSRHAVQ